MKTISTQRKACFYVGFALIGLGFLSFAAALVFGALHFGDFARPQKGIRVEFMVSGISMAMVILGSILRSIGVRGAGEKL